MHRVSTTIEPTEGVASGGSTSTSGLDSTNVRSSAASSIDDYNRVMLQYTQSQMAQFKNGGVNRRNSGQSANSGQSNSSVSNMARGASGPSPMSTSGSRTPGGVSRS